MKLQLMKFLGVAFLIISNVSFSAKASVVAFEWNEGGAGNGVLSPYTSFHNATGPVLADDFTPVVGGAVSSVEWWGSAPLTTSNNDLWEVTFHLDASGLPALTLPSGGISQHFVSAAGSDADGDGVWKYTALWTPQDVILTAGAQYWFSVANASGSTWQWALTDPIGPSVGSQSYRAHQSVGGLPSSIGGPHDGPWSQLNNPPVDLAFKINVVPVPAAVWLFGTALIGFIGFSRRRNVT